MESTSVKQRSGSIIVVEDEAMVAAQLRRHLEELGWDVRGCVSSGEEAVRLGALRRPDLMLMDVRLDGEMDGAEAAQHLNDQLGIPSVFLTAHTDRQTLERCKGALPLGYIVKPFDGKVLALTLEIALGLERTRQAKAREHQSHLLAEARYAEILRHSPDAVVTIDSDLNIVMYSGGAERCFQYSLAEVLGQHVNLLVPHQAERSDGSGATHFVDPRLTTHPRTVEYRRKDGSSFLAEVAVCRHEEGGRAFYTALIRDLSERRDLHARSIRAHQLQAVSRLAASVANEFNNLLQAVDANHYLLSLQAKPEQTPLLRDGAHLVARGSLLTRQLLSLSDNDSEAPVVQPLQPLLDRVAALAQRLLGNHVSVVTGPWPIDGNVRVETGQFEQVFWNLFVNARDAMPSGGELFISAAPHPALSGYVLIKVRDTGTGIDEADLPKVFDAFFTTKPRGTGAGLGLPLVKRIIERWDGFVSVRGEPGRGSEFGIAIPHADPEQASLPAETLLGAGETVIIIEPCPHTRAALAELLARHGYAAHTRAIAGDLWQSLQQAQRSQLVTLSLDAPAPLLLVTRTLTASLPLLAQARTPAELPAGCCTLYKPFAATDMLRLVRSSLTLLD